MPTASFSDIVSTPVTGGTASFNDIVSSPASVSSSPNRASFQDIVSPPKGAPRGWVPGITPPGAPPLPTDLQGSPDARYRPLPAELRKDFNPPRWIESGAKTVNEGFKAMAEPGRAFLSDIAAGPQVYRLKPSPHDPQPKLTPELRRQAAAGAHEVVSGAFEAATPLMIASGVAAPVKTAVTLGATMVGQGAVEAGLERLGMRKEYAAVAGDLAGFIVGAKAHELTDATKKQIATTLKDRYEAKTVQPPTKISSTDPTRATAAFEGAQGAIERWQAVPEKNARAVVQKTKGPFGSERGSFSTRPTRPKAGEPGSEYALDWHQKKRRLPGGYKIGDEVEWTTPFGEVRRATVAGYESEEAVKVKSPEHSDLWPRDLAKIRRAKGAGNAEQNAQRIEAPAPQPGSAKTEGLTPPPSRVNAVINARDRVYHATSLDALPGILASGINAGKDRQEYTGASVSRVPRIGSNFGGEGRKLISLEIDNSMMPPNRPYVETQTFAENNNPGGAWANAYRKTDVGRGSGFYLENLTRRERTEFEDRNAKTTALSDEYDQLSEQIYELGKQHKGDAGWYDSDEFNALNNRRAAVDAEFKRQITRVQELQRIASANVPNLHFEFENRTRNKPIPSRAIKAIHVNKASLKDAIELGAEEARARAYSRDVPPEQWNKPRAEKELEARRYDEEYRASHTPESMLREIQELGRKHDIPVHLHETGKELFIHRAKLAQRLTPPPTRETTTPKPAAEAPSKEVESAAQRIYDKVKELESTTGSSVTLPRLRRALPDISKKVFDDAVFHLEKSRKALLNQTYNYIWETLPKEEQELFPRRLEPVDDTYSSKEPRYRTYSAIYRRDVENATGFWKSEVGSEKGALTIPKEAVEAVGRAYEISRDILAPKSGVKPEKLDMIMGMQGDRAQAEYVLDQTMAEVRDKFSDRNQAQNIRYIDNLKEGKSQGDPYWDEVARGQRKIDAAMYAEVQHFKPDLPWKENHYRVIYKRPPEWAKQDPKTGNAIPLNDQPGRRGGIPNLGRSRPLRGTQGWAKKASLTNLSEGLGWEFEADPHQIQSRAAAAKLGPNDAIFKTVNYPSHTEIHITPTSEKGTAFVEAEEKLGTPLYKRGGVPISYNPQVLFETAVKDQMRYVTAQKLWEQMQATGNREFVRNNEPPPENMMKLNDRIAKVYFKVPQGQVSPGEWYVDKEMGKLLNNFLSPDWLRDVQAADASGNAILRGSARVGRGLLWAKNNLTAIELAMSPFHFAFESGETVASQFGIGFTRLWNEGVRHADPKQIMGGLADLAEAPIAPYTTSKLGGDIQAGIVSDLLPQVRPPATGTFGGNVKRAFQGKAREITPQDIIRGNEYLRKNPEAREAIGTLFRAGLKPEMAREYKLQSLGAMREAFNNARAGIDPTKNYIAAAWRVLPAMNQLVMKPLFEDYIPKLKMGQAMKEYSQQIRENSAEIAAGKITKDEIARNVVFRVEARFGEMNFDNLFWNNTMKSAMQILFRSATWRIGTVQGFGSAIAGQAAEFAEPLKAIADHAGSTKPRPMADYIPKLHPMMGWALGLIASRMIYSGIRQKLATGQMPQTLKDWMWPQTGNKDDRGKPLRENPPSYLNDAYKIWHNKTDYVTAGMSGFLKNLSEGWKNEDFFGNFVYDPEEPVYRKTLDTLTHTIGKPFFLSGWQRSSELGADTQTKVMGSLGVGRAPSEIDLTDAEKEAISINRRTTRKKTPEEAKEQTERFQIGRAMRAGDPAAVEKYNKLTRAQQRAIDRRGGQTYLQSLLEHMTAEDALGVWEKATAAERDQINDIIGKKLQNKLKKLNDEDQYEKLEHRAEKDGLLVH